MKKMLSIWLCVSMLLSGFFITDVSAKETDGEECAEFLHNLNLFYGDESGYALSKEVTRTESVIMALRLSGEEKEALSSHDVNPFSDVPSWAAGYVGYAYGHHLVSGMAANTFGAQNAVTANQYLTFLLRCLGYSDTDGDFVWNKAMAFSQKIDLIDEGEANLLSTKDFTRNEMVLLSYNALSQPIKGSGETLSSVLIGKDILDEKAVTRAGVAIASRENSNEQASLQETTVSSELSQKIMALMQKFPQGSYWNHIGGSNNPDGVTDTPCTHHGTGTCGYYPDACDCNSFNNAIQCLGFAYKIGNELFGTNVKQWTKFYDYEAVKVGDHVRYQLPKVEHSGIVVAKTEEGLTIADCNYSGGCGIRWDGFVSKDMLATKLIYYQTGQ